MSKYPPADSKTQWFQDNFPGATMNPNVLLLHTTEGFDWPTYDGGAIAPTYTAKPDLRGRRLSWRQHFPDEKSARALVNLPGGVETNTLNVIQVELIGTCDPAHAKTWSGHLAGVDYVYWPDAPDWLLAELADFVAYCHTEHGIPFVAPTFKAYPGSAGTNNGVRFSFAKWRAFTGICGHQHAPENTHGDPGDLDVEKLIALAKRKVEPPPPAPTPGAPIRDAHQSGRFDATTAETAAMLDGIAAEADVGGITEAVGLVMLRGWLSVGEESRVIWEDASWTLEASGTLILKTPAWKRGTSPRDSVDIEWAVLTRNHVTLLRLVGHLPAHLSRKSQRLANRAAIAGLGPGISHLQAAHTPTVTTLSLDANRGLRRPGNKRLFAKGLAGTGLEPVVPPRPTMRARTIDGFWTTGVNPSAGMLPRRKGFDHRGATLTAHNPKAST